MKFEGTAVTTGNTNDINYHRIFSAKRWWNQKVGFEIVMRDNNDKRLHGRGAQDNPNFNLDAVQSWKASEWEHITFVVNGQDKRITFYNDGAYKSSGGMSAPGSLSEGMMIGNDSELNDWGMDGKLDEIRFSPVMRSAEWIRFSYENQKAGADLFEFDNFQGPPYFGDVSDVYGKKGKLMSFNPPTFGTVENRTAVGLPAGLSYNTATGVISGTPIGGSSSDVTITLTGRGVTVTKVFKVQIADLDAFVFTVDANATGYAGSSTLSDFLPSSGCRLPGSTASPTTASLTKTPTDSPLVMTCVFSTRMAAFFLTRSKNGILPAFPKYGCACPT